MDITKYLTRQQEIRLAAQALAFDFSGAASFA
jgi:hypothetical protein